MKLSLVLLFVGVFNISASVYSQDARITINMKNVPLRTVLNELEKISHCTFFYNEDFIDLNKNVSIKVAESDMNSLLNTLFTNTGLTYKQIQDKMIVVAPVVFQQKFPVTGQVTDAANNNIPIAGVNISEKGTTNGTITDANGNYSLTVSDSKAVLLFSFIGYIQREINVDGKSNVSITMTEDVTALGEIVVTALGIKKSARSLTYSTQQVNGDELTGDKQINMINSLAGKSAGVVITQSASGLGGSAKVLLRGNKSMLGNNQPLYVIDGIPMNNVIGSQPGDLYGGYDGGDAISNLNPDDIESLNILKGASAAALYGSTAANGVILITTKKGKAGIAKVMVSSTTTFENPIVLPKIQNTYGQEIEGVSISSWGAKSSKASNAHIKDFFNTGKNYINSISITNGNDVNQFYVSYANTTATGIVPNNSLDKNNLSFKGTSKMWKNKLTIDAGVDYMNQKVKNRPTGGFYWNPILSTYLFPVGDKFSQYKTFEKPGAPPQQNWPYLTNESGLSSQNPYWIQNRNTNVLERNRLTSTVSANYSIFNWLKFQARMSYDRTTDDYEQDIYATSDNILTNNNGEMVMTNNLSSQMYTDYMLSLNKEIDAFTINATLGESNTWSKSTALHLNTNVDINGSNIKIGLAVPNVFTMENMNPGVARWQSLQEAYSQALFATGQFGYKNMLFLDVTGRTEWSSTSTDPTKPFFYPSAGLSYVLTETTGVNDILSFAKLRTSYSEVGNALPANTGGSYHFPNTEGGVFLPDVKAGEPLKPERTKSVEAGIDIRLLQNSVSMEFTFYNAVSGNQLFKIAAPAGFGAPFEYLMGGAIRNRGIEAVVGYKLPTIRGFSWESSVNMSANKNTVVSLSDKISSNYIVLNTTAQTKIYELDVPKGGSYGDFFGLGFKRDENGNIVKDATTGSVVRSDDNRIFLGNPNPKFLAGWSNTFKFKGLALKVLIDGRFGGKVVSLTQSLVDFKGLSQRSADARDNSAFTVGGTAFDARKFYSSVGGLNPVTEQYVYDATNIRMREMSLSYSIPKLFKGIDVLSVSLVGRNLFFFSNKAPFDPDMALTAGNTLQGLDAFGVPSTRSFGFTVNVSF